MPTQAPDLGGASPVWMIVVLAILIGPFVWAAIYGMRHRDSGTPKHEHSVEAPSMMRSLKDWIDVRSGGKGM